MRPQLTLPSNRPRSSRGHNYTNFVELHSLMLQAKFQNLRSSGSEECDLYIAMVEILVIILSNYDGLQSQMLHTKVRENQPAGSGEEDF